VTDRQSAGVQETIDFDGLAIAFDSRVLRPRPWTVAQSRWAALLLDGLPRGPVLELCAGAGQIGLAAVARSPRRLVCVDANRDATAFAAANAEAAGMTDRVEIRTAGLTEALSDEERFALVIADPPWVRRAETDRFPEDPLPAIDGGEDGLDVARDCVTVIGAHLMPGGAALLQLGSTDQVAALEPEISAAGLRASAVRTCHGGVVARLDPRLDPH
jgi:methylase of polypeptide subunit release factors